ncbi:MAG TPA: MFS transporter [Verrucomicrobiae bacterium]|nr:MFS transporter [Verrucomicrobiae bacterium]
MNQETTSKSQGIRTLFRNGQFMRYITGETISMTGTWMQMMAQGWIMTTLTDKAVMLGMVTFVGSIPIVALSLIGGTFADRHDKRAILLVTQVVQIAFAVLVGWLVATGQIRIWHIILVAFFLGISTAFEMPSAAALVPELVGKDHIAVAIAVDRSVFHGTRLVGPALAGYVIGIAGPAAAFYANALSFVALMIALVTIHPRPKGTAHEEEQRRGSIKDGFTYVRSDKPTTAMIMLLVTTVIFVFPVMMVMVPLYAKDILLLGPDKMGLLMGASGIGAFTGAVGLFGVRREYRGKLLLAAVCCIALALTGLATAHRFIVAAGSLIALSLGVSTLAGLTNTIIQERAPGPMRGRVSSIVAMSFFGLMPFAALGITNVSDLLGMRNALLISAAAYLTAGLYILNGPGRHLREPPAVAVTNAADEVVSVSPEG